MAPAKSTGNTATEPHVNMSTPAITNKATSEERMSSLTPLSNNVSEARTNMLPFTSAKNAIAHARTIMPPPSTGNTVTLEDRIQALPQELQDEILDIKLAECLSTDNFVTIEPGIRPPWQLAVNRRTRKQLLKGYYSTRVFHLPLRTLFKVFINWIASLSSQARNIVSAIQVFYPKGLIVDQALKCINLIFRLVDGGSLGLNKSAVKVNLDLSLSKDPPREDWVNEARLLEMQ